jgi:hypothetical protein
MGSPANPLSSFGNPAISSEIRWLSVLASQQVWLCHELSDTKFTRVHL